MQYALKAIQYASEIKDGLSLKSEYLKYLEEAPSNKFKNAAYVYEKFVKPAECDLLRVGAHYCISSIFEDYSDETNICCYSTKSDSYEQAEAGKLKFAVGKTHISSDITWDKKTISFAVLHFGDHNINAGVKDFSSTDNLEAMKNELKDAFERGDIPEVVRVMDTHFNGNIYSLWHLFKDEQKKVLDQILHLTYDGVETAYRQIYENNFTIINFYHNLQNRIPRPFLAAAEYIINTDLKRIFTEETVDKAKLKRLIDDTKRWAVKIDTTTIGFRVSSWVNSSMNNLSKDPDQPQIYEQIVDTLEILIPLSLSLNLWKAQNNYFLISKSYLHTMKEKAENGDELSKQWVDIFYKLGSFLHVKV
jgi:hypothetical protein